MAYDIVSLTQLLYVSLWNEYNKCLKMRPWWDLEESGMSFIKVHIVWRWMSYSFYHMTKCRNQKMTYFKEKLSVTKKPCS